MAREGWRVVGVGRRKELEGRVRMRVEDRNRREEGEEWKVE